MTRTTDRINRIRAAAPRVAGLVAIQDEEKRRRDFAAVDRTERAIREVLHRYSVTMSEVGAALDQSQ